MAIELEDTFDDSSLEMNVGGDKFRVAQTLQTAIADAASDAATAITDAAAASSAAAAASSAASAAQTTANAAVPKSLYDANTLLIADSDDTPLALAVAASRLVGRKSTGGIAALTAAEAAVILGTLSVTGFAWASNVASIDVSLANAFAATNTLTGNSTLTLTGGADGMNGVIFVKQDGTGSRTLGFTVSGRTVYRDVGVPDTNPFPAASSITMYQYFFVTVDSTAIVVINKLPISS